MDMSDKIRTLRNGLGLTLEDVGSAVGVGKSTVRKWETGDIKNMRRDKIAALAAVLQTSPAFLMGWGEETLTPATEDERIDEFADLMGQLTPEEQRLIVSQIKGILSNRE